MTDKMKYVQDSSILFKDTAADLAQTMLQSALDAAKRDLQQFDVQTQNKLIAFEERLNNLPNTGGNTISDERLEDLFKQLQDNAKFAALFATACINLDGVKYTNASLLEAIYLAPKVAEVNFNYDVGFNKISARIDLTDGRAVLMDRTWQRISGDNDPDEIWQERYFTNAWPNAIAGEPNFVVDVYENWVKRPNGVFQRLKSTNFIFSLAGSACPFDGMPSGIDINKDGIIGTPSAQPGTTDPNAGTGTTDPVNPDPNAGTGTTDPVNPDPNAGTGTNIPDPNDPNTDPGYQP
jgi:hypothetical protein